MYILYQTFNICDTFSLCTYTFNVQVCHLNLLFLCLFTKLYFRFVLLKERNMLLTMEHECKVQFELFPNPERIDKVLFDVYYTL